MANAEKLQAQEVFHMMVPLSIDYSTRDKYPVHPLELDERIESIGTELREQIKLWGGTSALIDWIQQFDPEFGSPTQLENLIRLARIDES